MGSAGQVNLGQAAFIGIGAFTSAILTTQYSTPFVVNLVISGMTAMGAGALLGLISVRLRADFLAITTIGINFVAVSVFQYYPLFGGSFGIGDIPRPVFFGYELSGAAYMALVYAVLTLCIMGALWTRRSWLGLAFKAIKEDEIAAMSMRIDVRKFKMIAFAIGAGYGGLAGCLLAHFRTYIVFSDFKFDFSIELLTIVVLGGLGSIAGASLGTAIVVLLPEIVRPLLQYRLVIYILMLIVILRFQPGGLLGEKSALPKYITRIVARVHQRENTSWH
jgi:branched-chain amino acid transport system permease protein